MKIPFWFWILLSTVVSPLYVLAFAHIYREVLGGDNHIGGYIVSIISWFCFVLILIAVRDDLAAKAHRVDDE